MIQPISSDLELKELIRKLEHDSALALEWFDCNYMKLNTDKCHLLIAGQQKLEYLCKNWERFSLGI